MSDGTERKPDDNPEPKTKPVVQFSDAEKRRIQDDACHHRNRDDIGRTLRKIGD